MITMLESRTLAHGALLRFDHPAGGRIRCTAGCLWITVDGDPCDRLLECGESFEPTGAARVLVYALANSALQSEPAPVSSGAPLRHLVATWLRRGRVAGSGQIPCGRA